MINGQDDDGEESKSLGRMLDCGNSITSHSENFQLDDSVMDFILKEDNNDSGSKQRNSKLILEPKGGEEDAQSGSGDIVAANAPKEAASSKNEQQIELIVEGEEEPVN